MIDTIDTLARRATPEPTRPAPPLPDPWGIDRFLGRLLGRESSHQATRVALAERTESGWTDVTYGQLDTAVEALAGRLHAAGVEPGSRVAILVEPGVSWVVAFFAILLSGAVVVPIDVKLTAGETNSILQHVQPDAIIFSATQRDRAGIASAGIGSVRARLGAPNVDEIARMTPSAPLSGRDRTTPAWRLHEPAIIVYTSGTTGDPKGVMLSFANLLSQIQGLAQAHAIGAEDVFLSILPLNHMFELICGLIGVLYYGAQVVYAGSLLPEDILRAARERAVTRMVVVPLFLKLVRRRVRAEAQRASAGKKWTLRAIAGAASVLPVAGGRRVLFRPVLQKVAPKLRVLYVGGAPLDAEDAMFFHRMGVAVYQGYGLTETSPVVTMNSPRANRFGSVGRPLHGVEVRIVTDSPGDAGRPVHRTGAPASTEGDGASGCEQGEILVRGPNVMLGYYRDPVATKAVISPDGWLHTGDVGYMDGDGFLHISGRSKNVIVLPNGKNVQPEEVEAALERLESVREACVFAGVGDHGLTAGTEQVQAVVVPSDALLGRGLSEGAVISLLEEEVRNAVRTLAAYKHPTRITVSFHELPKTATRKVQRSRVAACYR